MNSIGRPTRSSPAERPFEQQSFLFPCPPRTERLCIIMSHAFVPHASTFLGTSVAVHNAANTTRRKRTWSLRNPRMTQTLKPAPPVMPPTSDKTLRREPKKPSAKPKMTANGDSLESTPFQKALLTLFLATFSGLGLNTVLHIASPEEAVANVAALALSYVFTDLAVGVYHHAVDNYGSAETPIFGFQIAAFQGHHSFPWTITARGVANNLYRLTYATLPQLFLLMVLPLPSAAVTFYSSFLTFIVLSQETHRQAHMTRAAPWVRFLQDTGLILSQKAHAAHHLAPPKGAFEGNYCILSGFWNGILDRSRFFRLQEAVIFRITGTEPIAWSLNDQLKTESLQMLPAWLR